MDCVIENSLALKTVEIRQEPQDDFLEDSLYVSARLVELKNKLITVFTKQDRRTVSSFEILAVRDIIDALLYDLREQGYTANTELEKQLVEISNLVQIGQFQMALGAVLVLITPVLIPLNILEIELDYLIEPPVLTN